MTSPDRNSTTVGKVYLVGAGPGDPGLITLRGVEVLGQADAVVYDYLVNPAILQHAPSTAQLICLGRHGRERVLSQPEVNAQVVSLAQAGRAVVRLKGGDPMVFGRFGEEAEALKEAGVEFEIVAGVTAALAAGSCAAVPVTHREHASAVALVTGQEDMGKETSTLDFDALARFPGTLVIYMGVTTAERWVRQLIGGGKAADTPCAIVRRASFPDQRRWLCRLDEVGARIAEHHIRPPAIVIIGAVAQIDDGLAWFERRPLFGASVLVTRPRGQAESLAARLRALGADVGVEPAIDVAPTDDWSDVDRALERIGQFNWIVFSSTNGVDSCLERLRYLGKDWRAMGEVKIAAVGPATAARLAERDLRADHVPETFQADRLADDLAADANGRRFLLIRASRGREVLAERLTAAGGSVEQVVTYRSEDAPPVAADAIEAVRRGRWQWVTVTSPAIGRSLVQQYGDALAAAKLASISPVTSEALVGLGRPPACTAREATMPGVVDAIVAHRAENPE